MMKKQNRGFTMIELAITLVIAAILSAIVTPSFQTMMMNNTLIAQTNSLVSAFNMARSEAAKRDLIVTIKALDSSDSANEWGQGWNILVGTDVIKVFVNKNEKTLINSSVAEVKYSAEGFLVPMTRLEFEVCDDRTGEKGKKIILSPSGRVKTDNTFVCS